MQRPHPPRWPRAALEAGALGLALAALLRWPVSVFPHAIPHDPNSALHMVAAADFAATLDPLTLSSLDWPDGVPVRLIGWPLLLLALPLELLLPPVVAFHGAVLLFLALQAAGVGAIGALEGWGRPQRLAAAAAATLAPIGLLFLGNGQPENVVFFPILLAGWAATRGRMGLVAAGLLLAALSTPYQGLVAGIFALCGAALRGARGILGVGAVALLCALPVGAYFGTQAADAPGADLSRTRPADAVLAAPASLAGWVTPEAGLDGSLQPPGWAAPDRRWPQRAPATGAYLGWVLLLSGLFGLWRARREPLARAATAAGALCLLLALGDALHLSPTRSTGLPLPWRLLGALPGLDQMGATFRFSTGAALALAIGAGFAAREHRSHAVALCALLLVDLLAFSPARWPVQASSPRADALADALPPGPTLVWPGTPLLSTHNHAVLRLALERPIATFNGPPPADTRLPPGARPPVPETNPRGESAARWADRLQRAGARGLVELTPLPADHRQPLTTRDGQPVGELTVYTLAP